MYRSTQTNVVSRPFSGRFTSEAPGWMHYEDEILAALRSLRDFGFDRIEDEHEIAAACRRYGVQHREHVEMLRDRVWGRA